MQAGCASHTRCGDLQQVTLLVDAHGSCVHEEREHRQYDTRRRSSRLRLVSASAQAVA
jgi:hypothetical protein